MEPEKQAGKDVYTLLGQKHSSEFPHPCLTVRCPHLSNPSIQRPVRIYSFDRSASACAHRYDRNYCLQELSVSCNGFVFSKSNITAIITEEALCFFCSGWVYSSNGILKSFPDFPFISRILQKISELKLKYE